MQKLGISLLFFTLSLIVTSSGFAQSSNEYSWRGTIKPDSLVHLGDSIMVNGIIPEGKLKQFRNFQFPNLSNGPSKHYFTKNGERYYIDIIPPALKGTRVDSSDVWLLKAK
ncbi:MAG: hypothetical protein ACHQNE_03455 [Candidatus Kapaibacterium sp.]